MSTTKQNKYVWDIQNMYLDFYIMKDDDKEF